MSYGKTYAYNRFNELTSHDEDTGNLERKIKKKLREIEKLKKKNPLKLTPEENNKIKNEDYWKNYLNPKQFSDSEKKVSESDSEKKVSHKFTVKYDTPDDIKRKNKQLEKNRIKNKKRKEREIKQQKKFQKQLQMKLREEERKRREEERKRREEQWKRLEEERKRREEQWKRLEEERKRQEEECRLFEINREKNNMRNQIRQDYYKLSKKCKNEISIFRKLSLLYHPDKNINNEEWAEKMFKEFENMKAEHYENENKEKDKKKKIF
jgi:hypothetical protein